MQRAHSRFRKLKRNNSLEKTEIGGGAGDREGGRRRLKELNNIRKSH